MNKYTINFKSSAAKEFRKLPIQAKKPIRNTIDQLSYFPRPSGIVKLQGDDNLYRIRVGNYRIIYAIDDVLKLVIITRVKHRKDVYRD